MKQKRIIESVENRQTQFRRVELKAELRKEENEKGKLFLRGYPIVFDTPTKIDVWGEEITETILRTALSRTDMSEVYLLVGHNPDNLLGRAGINMRLEVDEHGLFFECEMPNTQYARDIYNLVESGIVDGMSFAFRSGDRINWESMTRTITDIVQLYEITITPFPAYKEASVVTRTDEHDNTPQDPPKNGEGAGENTGDEAAEKARAELNKKLDELEAI